MELKYGSGLIDLDIDKSFFKRILEPAPGNIKPIRAADLCQALDKTVDGEPLLELVKAKKPEKLAIIVEDKTRKNPEYPVLIKAVIDTVLSVCSCTIYLIIGYGTHPKQSDSESEILYGRENLERVILIHHDSRDPGCLKSVGALSSGCEFKVNSFAAEADFIITFGSIEPHTFAGFTGGRKAVLPGISSYETIRDNHSKVCLRDLGPGILAGNPIHDEMSAAARLLNVDFSIQLVRNARGETAGIFAGSIDTAFKQGVMLCRSINSVHIASRPDAVFVCCGGHPKDKSLYHSQRAITTAAGTVKPGGVVVVFAEFPEGVGNSQYYEWLRKPVDCLLSLEQKDIDVGVHSAYLTAKNLSRCTIILYSDIDEGLAKELHFTKMKDIEKIKKLVVGKFGVNHTTYLIPSGSDIMVECASDVS